MSKIKKYGIILTTIIGIFSSTLIVAKADTTPVINETHEAYIPFPATSPTAYGVRGVIAINFDDYVSGTLTCDIDCNDTLLLNFNSYVDFYCIGAEATVISNETQIRFRIEDQKTILFYYNSTYTGTGANQFRGLVLLTYKSKSLDVITHVNTSDTAQINTNLVNILSTLNYIKTYDETYLPQIANIATDTDTIITTLNSIKSSINTLDTQLGNTNWTDMNSAYYTFGGTSTSSSWTAITTSGANGYTWTGVQFNQSGIAELPNNLVWIRLPIAKRDGANNVILINGYGNTSNFDDYVYTIVRQTYVDIYIYVPTEYKGRYGDITMLNSVYEYQGSYPATVKMLSVTDDMYWNLLSYFEQIKSKNEILAKLDTLSTDDIVTAINTLPMARIVELLEAIAENTSEDVTQNITNFNANLDIINNVENDFNVDFGTHNEDIDITDINKPEYLETSITGFQTVFTRMFNLHIFKYPLLLTLLAAVILILLG